MASKISLPTSSVAITGKRSLAPPSPSPSNASSHGTPSKRMKREHDATPTPAAAAAAAAATNYGTDMLTQLTYAVEFLKSKGVPKTLQEVLDHLTLQHTPESQQQQFALLMRKHSRIQFLPGPKSKDPNVKSWRTGKYEFRAKIPGVKDKISLLDYLQKRTDASKLEVKDLKDGWPDCDKAVDELEADHKILVVRTKKDGHAKFIWLDNPRWHHAVDPEFRSMWAKIELPSQDDMVRKMLAIGLKPASEDPRAKIKENKTTVKQKKRANRTNKRVENKHMQGILKDYSYMKRG